MEELYNANHRLLVCMSSVKQLYDLQEIDLKVIEVQNSLADVRFKLTDDSALTSARQEVERLSARQDELNSTRRGVERTIADLQESVGKVEARLYGGAITSEREVKAAEEERSFTLKRHSEEEDELLEVMVEAEEVEAALAEAQNTLGRLETEGPEEKEELANSEGRLARELDMLGQHRDRIAPALSADFVSLYDSLRKAKDGHVVARVERGMCQGCRLTLSTMELQRARSSDRVVQCDSCRRILYVI